MRRGREYITVSASGDGRSSQRVNTSTAMGVAGSMISSRLINLRVKRD